MCGITGAFSPSGNSTITIDVLRRMTDALAHRGPDDATMEIVDNRAAFGFRRLSIVDIEGGAQPFWNDDHSVFIICNGEIFNFKELSSELQSTGCRFRSQCDVEVIIHLYMQMGISFVQRLNGQFAFAIFDLRENKVFLVRDHFGICPLFYTVNDGEMIFGSEIKSILQNGKIQKAVNLTALDQTFTFPGLLSPFTFFDGVFSVKPGHWVVFDKDGLKENAYWDINYPKAGESNTTKSEEQYIEELDWLLNDSVRLRLNADVPVGFYLSGGLDSSLLGSLSKKANSHNSFPAFSIQFPGHDTRDINEEAHQTVVKKYLNCHHHEIPFTWSDIEKNLRRAVWHSECALKETYNTCSLALSEKVNSQGIKVVLSGEGADEIFGGYPGYRFDFHRHNRGDWFDMAEMVEKQVNQKMWTDADFFYEQNLHEIADTKKALYSVGVNENYNSFDSVALSQIDRNKLKGRHSFHKRSYIDLKMRLGDHLIADHCDRVCYANSIEGRYPFLDRRIIDLASRIPPDLMMKNLTEKYLLKRVAANYLPAQIVERQKFGFVAPGSPHLLQNKVEWIEDMLSEERIKRQGYFNPLTIERLKKRYRQEGFKLNIPFESDLLIVVLSFNILLDLFELPNYTK